MHDYILRVAWIYNFQLNNKSIWILADINHNLSQTQYERKYFWFFDIQELHYNYNELQKKKKNTSWLWFLEIITSIFFLGSMVVRINGTGFKFGLCGPTNEQF